MDDMDNNGLVFNFQVGVLKTLHTEKILTKEQLDICIKKLKKLYYKENKKK